MNPFAAKELRERKDFFRFARFGFPCGHLGSSVFIRG